MLCVLYAYWPQLNGELLKKFIVDIRRQLLSSNQLFILIWVSVQSYKFHFFFLEWWCSGYLLDISVFFCCVKNFHKVCSIKQYQVLFHSSVVRHRSMTWMVNLLTLLCGQNQNVERMHSPVLTCGTLFFKNYLFILLYNIVLVLPYIDLNPPWVYMCSPSWTPSQLPPHPIPLSHPNAPAQASCIMHRTWTGDSFPIWHFTCFNAILTYHPALTLSHRVQKGTLSNSFRLSAEFSSL